MERIIQDPLKEVKVLFFLFLFFIIVIEILLFSSIRIKISNLNISTERANNKKIDDNYKINISFLGLFKIRLLNIYITEEKLKKINIKNKLKINIKNLNYKKIIDMFKNNEGISLKDIKKIKKCIPNVKYINLLVDIGTEDAIITSYIVAFISSIIGIVLRKTIPISKDNRFIINPVYKNKNLLNLELNCIFEIKLIHIIYIIYILNKKGRDGKDGRTSDRRSYDYSYE